MLSAQVNKRRDEYQVGSSVGWGQYIGIGELRVAISGLSRENVPKEVEYYKEAAEEEFDDILGLTTSLRESCMERGYQLDVTNVTYQL